MTNRLAIDPQGSRSNCIALLAGNSAFFLFSAQQVLDGSIPTPIDPFGIALLVVPVIAAIGIALSYVALLLSDHLDGSRRRANWVVGFSYGTALGAFAVLLVGSTIAVVAYGISAASA